MIQQMLGFVVNNQPSQASGCVYIGDACCKLMSNGLYRCSWPDQPGQPGSGGACTPGLDPCPAWLVTEIKKSFNQSTTFAAQPGFPSRRRSQKRAMRMAMTLGQRF